MMSWFSAHAGLLGLLFFFGFFIAMTFWVYRPGAAARYARYARLPLHEDSKNE